MASIVKTALQDLLATGPYRVLTGGKQLTLAFAGLYIANTTIRAKPVLVWETESGYPRYYVPKDSLHAEIRSQIDGTGSTNGGAKASGTPSLKLESVDTVEGKNDSKAIIERLTIGSRSTTWVRFAGAQLDGFVRFERKEIGKRLHKYTRA